MPAIRIILLLLCCGLPAVATQVPYQELYRPQYHFTPKQGWIGDPDGLIRYQGKYHLFWWGHAESSGLVYWNQRPYPMKGGNETFAYYTGSVVVDTNNTSGLGTSSRPPMIAIYTAHQKRSGLEQQCLSVSTNYSTFEYYAGNPVLDIRSKSFRDPDVFWDSQSRRWIMVVALPDERKVNFYASTNLKSWQYISQFGAVGAREQVWEVPNLLQLPLNGNTNQMKWVLVCGMGPNKEQFFVGDFDGTNFVMDPVCQSFLSEGTGLPGRIFADFESAKYVGWSPRGAAFGAGPVAGVRRTTGYLGTKLASSLQDDMAATGKLISQPFTVVSNCINFLIGGSNHPGKACLNLLVNGVVVRTASGSGNDVLKWAGWDVAEFKGRQAQLEIVDDDPRGFIRVDHILFSNGLMDFHREQANWIDWGPDFYAARAFRDYDHGARTDCWMGWMDNWEYARDIPTSWGRGAESIPRVISLVTSPQGYAVRQQPWPQLRKLRGTKVTAKNLKVRDIMPLSSFHPRRNTYEIKATFVLDSPDQNCGLNLCVGGTNKVVVGYNARNHNIYLDRRASGNTGFNPLFSKFAAAPFAASSRQIRFHIFVDQSSIEVFVNGGAVVMTALIFPSPASRGVELFSLNGVSTLRNLSVWGLKSIW